MSLCVICQTYPAAVHCVECDLNLCYGSGTYDCNSESHQSQNKKYHHRQSLLGPNASGAGLCELCEEYPSEVNCRDCDMKMCGSSGNDCDHDAHINKPNHVRHSLAGSSSPSKNPSSSSVVAEVECELCTEFPAKYHCVTCDLKMCGPEGNDCDSDMHKAHPDHGRTFLGSQAAAATASPAVSKPSASSSAVPAAAAGPFDACEEFPA